MEMSEMNVTEKEKAMLIAMRTCGEIPVNFVMWYCYGLETSAEKIKDIDSYQSEISKRKAIEMRNAYRSLTE